ncbi:MAG: hypothetical protein LBP87_10810 [Planctomycetaceae bacterium]|jgi:hypothetical protein|nr:hypothetical protein [Planctomycetaceae bacterium]
MAMPDSQNKKTIKWMWILLILAIMDFILSVFAPELMLDLLSSNQHHNNAVGQHLLMATILFPGPFSIMFGISCYLFTENISRRLCIISIIVGCVTTMYQWSILLLNS